MDKITKNENQLISLIVEQEAKQFAQKKLIKTDTHSYTLDVDGTTVKLVFDSPATGISLEKALAKIALAKKWGQNG